MIPVDLNQNKMRDEPSFAVIKNKKIKKLINAQMAPCKKFQTKNI